MLVYCNRELLDCQSYTVSCTQSCVSRAVNRVCNARRKLVKYQGGVVPKTARSAKNRRFWHFVVGIADVSQSGFGSRSYAPGISACDTALKKARFFELAFSGTYFRCKKTAPLRGSCVVCSAPDYGTSSTRSGSLIECLWVGYGT